MNRTFAILAAIAALFAVSPTSQSFAGSSAGLVGLAARASVGTPLSGAEIRTRLVGNTIVGVEDGEAYAEYLAPDGTISGVGDSGAYTGAWRVSGDQICFRYDDDEDRGGGWDCEPVTLVGSGVYWSREIDPGAPAEATLLAGNPKNL